VFAPTNAAFELLFETLDISAEQLLTSSKLEQILRYHVAPGVVRTADLSRDGIQSLQTLQGSSVDAAFRDDGLKINYARVIQPDIGADNGVIHVIDSVLLPPVDSLAEPSGSAAQGEDRQEGAEDTSEQYDDEAGYFSDDGSFEADQGQAEYEYSGSDILDYSTESAEGQGNEGQSDYEYYTDAEDADDYNSEEQGSQIDAPRPDPSRVEIQPSEATPATESVIDSVSCANWCTAYIPAFVWPTISQCAGCKEVLRVPLGDNLYSDDYSNDDFVIRPCMHHCAFVPAAVYAHTFECSGCRGFPGPFVLDDPCQLVPSDVRPFVFGCG